MDILIFFFWLNFHIVMTQKKNQCSHYTSKGFFGGIFFKNLPYLEEKKMLLDLNMGSYRSPRLGMIKVLFCTLDNCHVMLINLGILAYFKNL